MRALLFGCSVVLTALLLGSCGVPQPHYVDYFPYHENGMAKPAVALVPVINRSACETTPWDFAEEISAEMRYQVMDDGVLFLIGSQQLDPALEQVKGMDLMGNDISYSKRFGPSDFLVVTELLEHRYVPYSKGQEVSNLYSTHGHYCDQMLAMKVRIRMIDLRGEAPCVVLQEIIESNHMIGPNADKFNGDRLAWRTANYRGSPLSVAHQRLAKDVVKRIETIAYTTR